MASEVGAASALNLPVANETCPVVNICANVEKEEEMSAAGALRSQVARDVPC